MNLWEVVVLRVGLLSGERVAFHGLGRHRHPLATTVVAYGGATVILWALCGITGNARWIGAAFWPGAVYAVSYTLYTAALSKGPLSLVSGFANATVMMLFLTAPHWDMGTLTAMGLFVLGAVCLLPRPTSLSIAVLWMLLSDAALVAGRLLDARQPLVLSMPYAASLFTAVLGWLIIPVTAYGLWGRCLKLVQERPAWSLTAALLNGLSYLTVLSMLQKVSPTIVEAVSAWAGVVATVLGVVTFREGKATWTITGATLMTIGTVILLFSPHQGMG